MKICFNGEFFEAGQPILTASNRSFKWGDGVFETMKFSRGKLLLADLHFERLFSSLRLLRIHPTEKLTKDQLLHQISFLCQENQCKENARVRLAVYRDEAAGSGYVVEAVSLDEHVNHWQELGLRICLYPFARKAMDAFSNLKSANYLPYVLAKNYATDNGFDDAIVLNTVNLLCDSSKANLFLNIKNELHTPALHQGCVNGVMRRMVIDEAEKIGLRVRQGEVSESDLLVAEEVFLTNAIQIIRWVKSYRERTYTSEKTKKLFSAVSATIFPASC